MLVGRKSCVLLFGGYPQILNLNPNEGGFKMKALLLVLVAAMVFVSVMNADAAISYKDEECLLYLPCNEGKGDEVNDMSPYGNHGVAVGTVKWGNGPFGTCLEFAEGGEVKCPHIALDSKSWTICIWVNCKLTGGAEQCVFSQTQANATNTSMHFRIYTNATVRMGFYSNDLDAVGAAKKEEWMHIAYCLDLDAKKRRIYVNGEQIAQDAGVAGLPYLGTTGDTMVGSWGATGQKFNGMIDEVQIWDKALTEAEIRQSMGDMLKGASVNPAVKLASTWGNVKR